MTRRSLLLTHRLQKLLQRPALRHTLNAAVVVSALRQRVGELAEELAIARGMSETVSRSLDQANEMLAEQQRERERKEGERENEKRKVVEVEKEEMKERMVREEKEMEKRKGEMEKEPSLRFSPVPARNL